MTTKRTHTVLHIVNGTLTAKEYDRRPTLADMQALVGGLIERAWDEASTGGRSIDVWANEEGLLNGMQPNVYLPHTRSVLHGPVFVSASNADGETVGLTPAEVARVVCGKQHLVARGMPPILEITK
jgi:hypothetical protein